MDNLSDNQVSVYEEPAQEKIRKFIRIEALFARIIFFKSKENKIESYQSISALCELHELLSRSDIKSELIREIETHNTYFKKIKDLPDADSDKLHSILEKQKALLDLTYSVKSNYLDYLENDIVFKTLSKNTLSQIQPSSVEFWFTRDIMFRETQIDLWIEPLMFIKKSIDFILDLVRKSGNIQDKLATKGFIIEKLDQKKNILLIRVTLTSDVYYYPQISVGKQRLNIMFMTKDDKNNFIPHQEDVSFVLSICSL